MVQFDSNGSPEVLFTSMSWTAMSEDVLLFKGNGKYGTLIKGLNIDAGSSPATWHGTTQPTEAVALKWLILNCHNGALAREIMGLPPQIMGLPPLDLSSTKVKSEEVKAVKLLTKLKTAPTRRRTTTA